MKQVRIGLIGAGVIGGTHSAVLKVIADALAPQVELVAVADPDAGQRAQATSLYGYREQYSAAAELLAKADIDTVFVCTPTAFHAQQVHAAVDRGLHVFCEKPLAMSFAEGSAMVRAITANRRRAQIGLVLRFSAVYTVLRQLMKDPRAGKPLAVIFRDDQCFPIRGVHDSAWRADRSLTAGGTLIEHGVHDLDILTWFFGPIARLRAWERNHAGHPGVEDYMAIELEHASGLRAQLVNLWHGMIQRPSNRRLEIFCENGFFASEADMGGEIQYQFGDDATQCMPEGEVLERFSELQPSVPDPLRAFLRVPYLLQDLAFVQALLDERPADPDISVGLEAQRLAEAAYHAARTDSEVELASFMPPA